MNHDAAPLVFILLIGALPLAMFLHDWWTLRGIPDPQPGDIWRSQNSGEAFRIDKVGLTHCGMLTWDYTIETAPLVSPQGGNRFIHRPCRFPSVAGAA